MNLRNKDKEKLIGIFSDFPLQYEVWAFGSRVNGDAHEGSDLDLVIRTCDLQPLPADVYNTLQNRIRESTIPIIVELFDWARLPKRFLPAIEARHEVIYPLENTGNLDAFPNK